MRKFFSGIGFVVLLVSVPALAQAQRRAAAPMGGAKHEFGVDLGIAYYDPNGGQSGIRIGTPLDVRVGFVSAKKLQWEGRIILDYDSKGAGTAASYVIAPGVNAIFAMNGATNRKGMYLTGGGNLDLVKFGATSATGFSFNGAVGWRKPYGGGAWRYELGIKYDLEASDGAVVVIPKTLSIGARIGISLWH